MPTPSFRYHPGVVAQAFATLACLFPGRVILGLGTGESMNEVPLGIAWPDPPGRFARLKESIEGEYVGLGFDHLVFHGPGPDQARFLRDFGAEVLPRLRRAYP